MVIAIDMDGTIADLYSVADWLPRLRAQDATAYRDAAPLVDAGELRHALAYARATRGVQVEFVTWGSRGDTTPAFECATEDAKRDWLDRNGFTYDALRYAPHGTPKSTLVSGPGVLIDDEDGNRREWEDSHMGRAFDPTDICRRIIALADKVRASRP